MKSANVLFTTLTLAFLSWADGQEDKDIRRAALTKKGVANSGNIHGSGHRHYFESMHQDSEDSIRRLGPSKEDAKNDAREAVSDTKELVGEIKTKASKIKSKYRNEKKVEKQDYKEKVQQARAKKDEELEKLLLEKDNLGLQTYREKKAGVKLEFKETLEKLSFPRSEKKMKILEDYVEDLAKLTLEVIKAQHEIPENIEAVDENEKYFEDIQWWFDEKRAIINTLNDDLITRERSFTEEIERMETVMMKNICFEFWGVSGEIPENQIHAFNDIMKAALQQALDDEGTDATVIAFALVLQKFVPNEELQVRRRLVGDGERSLRTSRDRLYVDAVAGLRCNCYTDTLSSDVTHRRELDEKTFEAPIDMDSHEQFRLLTDDSVMKNFAILVRDLAEGVFGKLVSVNTVGCADMKLPNPFK